MNIPTLNIGEAVMVVMEDHPVGTDVPKIACRVAAKSTLSMLLSPKWLVKGPTNKFVIFWHPIHKEWQRWTPDHEHD